MAKISLSKLNLEKNSDINTITINDNKIEVLSYLPIHDKISLIDVAIQESIQGQSISPMLVDCLFHMYLVMSYTNITFSSTQKSKLLETYDLMEKNGLIDAVVEAIPSNEYNDLLEGLTTSIEATEKQLMSIANIVKLTLEQASEAFTRLSSDLEGLDLNSDKIQSVLAIAKDNGVV